MAKGIPLLVMGHQGRLSDGDWVITVGRSQFRDTKSADGGYDTKENAISQATTFASQDDRPGVAVYTSRGEFQRFIVNGEWFAQFMWEDL